MEKVTQKLLELMKLGYPELTEAQSKLKVERWMKLPNLRLGNSTPKELCEKGRSDKVLLLVESFFGEYYMAYGGPKVLDLTEKLTDNCIRELVLGFDNMNPEEKMILLEEYSEKYYQMIELEDVRRRNE